MKTLLDEEIEEQQKNFNYGNLERVKEEPEEKKTYVFMYQTLPEYKKLTITEAKRFDSLFIQLCYTLEKSNNYYASIFYINEKTFSTNVASWERAGLIKRDHYNKCVDDTSVKKRFVAEDRRIWLSPQTFPELYNKKSKEAGISFYLTLVKIPAVEVSNYVKR